MFYSASALIMVRSVFRVVEYVEGNNGYIMRREALLYVFDAVLMFFVMVLFNIFHTRLGGQSDQRKEELGLKVFNDDSGNEEYAGIAATR